MESSNIRIALAGNPNCGKTTLFNALTGSNQFVGNWPGVTVEKKEGNLKKREGVIITDLPGIYSLSPYTLEEVVARNYLVGERPDAILNIVDGTNLERNLYLTTQLAELGIPVVVAINMMDVIRKRGDTIDIDRLSRKLGCRIVEISALKGTGITEAAEAAIEAAKEKKLAPIHRFSGSVEHAIAHIEEATVHGLPQTQQRFYAIKIFERDQKVIEALGISPEVIAHIENDIRTAERELDDDAESIITNERYNCVERILAGNYKRKNAGKLSTSDRIDGILTNKWLGLPIFALIMFLVYYISVTTVGTWATDFTNDGLFGEGFEIFGKWIPGIPVLAEWGLDTIGCVGWLKSLLIDGIIGGVGAVLGFVPQLFVLFIFLAFLEACGYMARIAFVLDRIFRKFGLSGKSFIPMLIGTGCSVPGIMASRTIENESDRKMTVITTSFIPCGAKLPVIAMIASALFGGPDKGWWLAPLCYFVGIVSVIISGIILKKTKIFLGESAPFVMELPSYHMPTFANVMRSTWERSWSFIKKAGTVILLSTIIIWLGSTVGVADGSFGIYLEAPEGFTSLLDYLGMGIAWLFAPLGFAEPTAAVATLMGLIAKEEIVAVFGVTEFAGLGKLAGLSFLLFNLLCAPCFAAMGAIKREMNSAKWTAFAISYQCVYAYIVSFIVYQLGTFIYALYAPSVVLGSWNIVGAFLALILVVLAVYLLVKPEKSKKSAK